MKNHFTLILFSISFCTGSTQALLNYVSPVEGRKIYDISTHGNIQIGVGHSDPCGNAYICALTGDHTLLWDTTFNDLYFSFFTDVLRVNDSTFYAVGEEWEGEDISSIRSVFVARMNISGTVLSFNKYTDPQLISGLYGYLNCKINQLPSKDIIISVDKQLAYINDTGVIFKYVHLTERIHDFKPRGQDQILYVSNSSVYSYTDITSERLWLTGFKNLKSIDFRPYYLYVQDENSLFRFGYGGLDLIKFSDTLGCKSVVDYVSTDEALYVIGEDLNGENRIFEQSEFQKNIRKTISLAEIKDVSLAKLDVDDGSLSSLDDGSILISGRCNYGLSNEFFISMDQNYTMPEITKDIGISDFRQTDFNVKIADSFPSGLILYTVSVGFEYKITNHDTVPVNFFNVYSDIYDGINCLHIYYSHYHNQELLPGASVVLSGTAIKSRTTNKKDFFICLYAVAPDLELDKNPADNTSCRTLVSIDDPIHSNPSFQIYPNPAYDVLTISKETSGDYQIYNSVGMLITGLKDVNNIVLNIKDYKPGMYFIKDQTLGNQGRLQKFIKL